MKIEHLILIAFLTLSYTLTAQEKPYSLEKDRKTESKWHCFPNPVNDILNVSVLLEHKQDLNFSILNAQGQVIAYHNRKNVLPGKYLFRFDVSHYQPGMYFISINLEDQNNTQKIIKQ